MPTLGSNTFSPAGPWRRRDADTSLSSLSCRWCVMRMALRATPLCTLRPRMLQIGPSRRWTACCSTTAKCECHSRQQQRSHAPGCISVLTGTHKALVLLAQALACYLSTPGLVSDPAQAMACYPSIPGLVGFPDRALICHLSVSGLGWALCRRASGSPWPATAQVIFLVGLWPVCRLLLSPFLVPIPSSYYTLIFFASPQVTHCFFHSGSRSVYWDFHFFYLTDLLGDSSLVKRGRLSWEPRRRNSPMSILKTLGMTWMMKDWRSSLANMVNTEMLLLRLWISWNVVLWVLLLCSLYLGHFEAWGLGLLYGI